MKIREIILYDEPIVPEIRLERLARFVSETFAVRVRTRESISEYSGQDISERIAGCRIFDLKKPFKEYGTSARDMQAINNSNTPDRGGETALYDGFEFHRAVSELVPDHENKMDTLHVIFTDKLTCTFDEEDSRYHARALIVSNPAIISTTGIIEAPAKPRQYYLDMMTSFSEKSADEIRQRYKGEFLEYHDSRMSEVTEGYLIQVIMYYETGEAFCRHVDCRLYNAHWQKELFSQLENKKFCKRHQGILSRLKGQ